MLRRLWGVDGGVIRGNWDAGLLKQTEEGLHAWVGPGSAFPLRGFKSPSICACVRFL